MFKKTFTLAALTLAVLAPLASAASLTLYNAQHEQLVNLLVKDFEKESGVSVRVRNGEGPELAAQLLKEGAASPADVYFTENSPELMLLEEKNLLAKVNPAALGTVPAKYNSPAGQWLGVMARENVLAYNTGMIKPEQLPASLMDLAGPAWKGKVAIAPADGDFPPLVSAVLALKGREATLKWLEGLRDNAQIFDDEEGVVAAVNRGGVAVGVINNYYWSRLHLALGDKATRSAIHHFGGGDVGALVNVSGAAVLKNSRNQDAAQQFLTYLVSDRAQQLIAHSHIAFEYPLRGGVAPDASLKPFDQLQPPALTPDKQGDDAEAAKLMRQAGLL